jgi:hypothetical protein
LKNNIKIEGVNMKTKLIALAMMLTATLGYEGKASAQASGQGLTFQISNQQSESLGTVTVTSQDQGFYVAVPGTSFDSVDIDDTAISITIFGQTVPQGQQAYVTLPDGTIVAVLWETTSEVIVLDKDEID